MKFLATALAATFCLSTAAFAQQGKPGANFLDQWDLNADGQVTLAEAREKRADVFRMFDKDDSQTLTAPEWDAITTHIAAEESQKGQGQGQGQGHGGGPGQFVHAAMQPGFNDADKDGTVTAAEFEAATDALFPQIDRNGDGVVTVADFGRG